MYERFLLYGMLFTGAFISLGFSVVIFLDLIFLLFGRKISGELISFSIYPIGRETYVGQWHAISVKYKYMFNGVEYTNTTVNTYNHIVSLNERRLNKMILNIIDSKNSIKVYVFPLIPNQSIILPFKYNAVLIFGFVICNLIVGLISKSML